MAEGTGEASDFRSPGGGKLKVFISYSRDDLDFADQLVAGLELCGFDPMLDRHEISGGEAWQQRLGALIRDADTVAFVLSPTSAISKICAWEVEEAARLSKRILPVVCTPLTGVSAPPQLEALNYIFFYREPDAPGSGFGSGLARLVAALNTDVEWVREHTRLLMRATEWDKGGRPANRLLSGGDIVEAKAWAARRPKDASEPTALHLDFIRASEEEEASRASAERKRLDDMAAAQDERAKALQAAEDALQQAKEAQRARDRARTYITWLSASASVILAAVAAFAVVQYFDAKAKTAEAEDNLWDAEVTRSRLLADIADRYAKSNDQSTRLLLALEALPDAKEGNGDRPFVFEARTHLTEALRLLRERRTFSGTFVVADPTGRLVLTASGDKVQLWEAETGRVKHTLEGSDIDRQPVFSPDGRVLLTVSSTRAVVWDTESGKELRPLSAAELRTANAVFSSDGKLLATTSGDETVRLWSTSANAEPLLLRGPGKTARSAVFSDDGKLVLTLYTDKGPRLWDAATGAELAVLAEGDEPVNNAVFSPDGKLVLTIKDTRIQRRVADRMLSRPAGKALKLWDVATGQQLDVLGGAEERVNTAVFSPDGKFVLTAPRTKGARIWDISASKPPLLLGEYETAVSQALFSPDGKLALTLSNEGTQLFNAVAGTPSHQLDTERATLRNAFFSPDGKRVVTTSTTYSASGTTITLRIWDTSNGKRLFDLGGHGDVITGAVFIGGGASLLTTSQDNTARTWDLGDRSKSTQAESVSTQSAVDAAKEAVGRCLAPEQRKELRLAPKPPFWCIRQKPPFDTQAWASYPEVGEDGPMALLYGNFADAALYAGNFVYALDAAELALKFVPKSGDDLRWIRVNKAHALMFLDRLKEAREEYLSHRGEQLAGKGTWEEEVVADFKKLREKGRKHPLMFEIAETFKKPLPPD